ncbi:MAG: PQQ-binding-like beta-propeller repeat protein [Verrucomicrobiales bacterium]
MKSSVTFAAAVVLIASLQPAAFSRAKDQWWQFRGPEGNGHSRSSSLPLKWDQKNIVWKTAIHDRGWSSPVIWGSQIWMTTATKAGHEVYAVCVDKNTGKVVHDLPIFKVESPMAITLDNTYATPTPVIEEGRVYVHYGTYGTACLDTKSGDILWSRRDLNCDHEAGAGPASSPILVDDFLVFHVDGRDVQYVIALHKSTGKNAWKTERSVNFDKVPAHERKAYGMPAIVPRGDKKQMISVGAKGLYSYDPSNGEELWKVRHRGWSIFPKPIHGHGLVFATIDRDRPELWAIRPDGSGDVSDTHVVWKKTRRMPQRVSPLLAGDLLFVMDRSGYFSCLEAKTGKELWQHRLKGKFSASPILTKDRIYLFNQEGVCKVIKAARKFEVLATNPLGDAVQLLASPAVDGNAFYIRTAKHLYRIE